MNVFTCEGRIVQNAELRKANDTSLASFRLASNVGFGDKQTTLWIDCTIWGNRADSLVTSLVKGQQVMVSGELSERTFNRQDGSEGKALQLRVNDLGYGKSPAGQSSAETSVEDDDDIPF